jgi:YrbI family 3-deoxy-D-manno-octulosonate 8-phosphate phosphatase
MVETPEVLVLIPAWSDQGQLSTNLASHPLVEYTLAAAAQMLSSTKVVLLTQGPLNSNDALSQIARNWWASLMPVANQAPLDFSSGCLSLRDLTQTAAIRLNFQPGVVLWLDPWFPLRPKHLLEQAASLVSAHLGRNAQSVTALNPASADLWTMNEQGQLGVFPNPPMLYAQTGHVFATSYITLRSSEEKLPAGFDPLVVDSSLSPDLRQPSGWQWADWTLQSARLDLVYPHHTPRPLPVKTSLLVMDFDGVLTDNRVWVDEQGHEQISAYRSDSLGLIYLRQTGVDAIVISMETNPVVAARCRKMKIPALQGINDKATSLSHYLEERHIDPATVVYLGNDMNDVPCFPLVGCAVVVSDAQPGALRQADLVLTRRGGHGAVRELCDRLIERNKGQ